MILPWRRITVVPDGWTVGVAEAASSFGLVVYQAGPRTVLHAFLPGSFLMGMGASLPPIVTHDWQKGRGVGAPRARADPHAVSRISPSTVGEPCSMTFVRPLVSSSVAFAGVSRFFKRSASVPMRFV